LCVVRMAPCADGTLCGFDTDARRVAQIHALLEADFVPLELCARLAPLLEALEGLNKPLSAASPVLDAALGQYKRALQQARPRPRPPSVVYEPGRGPVPDAALGQYKRALQQARPGRGARMRRARRAGGRLPGLVAGRAPCDAAGRRSRTLRWWRLAGAPACLGKVKGRVAFCADTRRLVIGEEVD